MGKASERFNAALYLRLSREDGDKNESDSIINQRNMLISFINKSQDIDLFDFYSDDGYSGTNFDRPDFKRMIADIERGSVNCVIVKDLSRLGRDYIETGRFTERYFPQKNVRFIAVNDGIDSLEEKQSYDIIMPIKNIFNEQYARDISKKVQTSFKAKQKNGEFVGAFPSYGYFKDPKDRHSLVIDEYAAQVVKKIFSLYINGYGKVRIAKILNQEGILCPSEYKKSLGMNYKNPNKRNGTYYWTYATVCKILSNEMYIGNMVQGRTKRKMKCPPVPVEKENWIVVENTHQPIIDMDTWNTAQRLLDKKRKDIQFGKDVNIFSGLLKCGDCGRMMNRTKWGSGGIYFSCSSYRNYGVEICSSHVISQNTLEKIILEDLNSIIRNMDSLEEMVESERLSKEHNDFYYMEAEKTKALLEKVKRLKKDLYEDCKEGLIDKEEYFVYRKEYEEKEKLYMGKISALLEKEKNESLNLKESWEERLLKNRSIDCLDRQILAELIKEICVYEGNRIKIVYNFSDEMDIFMEKRINAQ